MRHRRQLTILVLVLGLAMTACADSEASGGEGGGDGSSDATSTTLPAANALDACVAIDAAKVTELSGLDVAEGTVGEPYGTDSLCNFVGVDGGVSVAVQLGRRGGGPDGDDAAFLTQKGFERAYGPSTPVPRVAHEGYGALVDDQPMHLAAALSTDGEEYALVTLVGADVVTSDIDVAADLLRELEKGRLRIRYGNAGGD